MGRMKPFTASGFFLSCLLFNTAIAQQVTVDTSFNNKAFINQPQKPTKAYRHFIVPASMLAYGLVTLAVDPLKDANEYFQKEIWVEHPHQQFHADDFLQYAPAIAVYGLNTAGVKGKNNFRDRTAIFLLSNIFLNAAVIPLKGLTKVMRPDGSSRSFPSGHTAEAFAGAEFLREEYRSVSAWYGITGYATATATGFLRIYNNRHWLNDVIAGAGVGIISTKLAYLVYPAIKKLLFHHDQSNTVIMPFYQNNSAGLAIVYQFH